MERTITVQGIEVTYDLEALAAEVNQIPYEAENFINHHRTSGDGVTPHEGAPTEEEFIRLRSQFANEILGLEESLERRIIANLHLTKAGVLAKGRRRPILEAHSDFFVNVIDEYDHDLQFDRPYVKMERLSGNTSKLIIWEMQTNY